MSRRSLALVSALAALSMHSGIGQAAEGPSVKADLLFQKGRAEVAAGHYEKACPDFQESYRIEPAVGTLLNIADCTEHLGHPASALGLFTQALAELAPSDPRIAYVRDRVARLEVRVPRLEIVAPTAGGVTVFRDQVELGPSALDVALPVEPGRHIVVVRSPGHRDRETVVDLAEGTTRRVAATPGAPFAGTPARAPGPVRPDLTAQAREPGPTGTSLRTRLAWVFGGVGVAALITGSVAGVLAMHDASVVRDRCPGHICVDVADFQAANQAASDGKTMATLSTVGFTVGLAGLAAGSTLWLMSRRSESARQTAWVLPWAGKNSAGLVASAGFQ